MGELSGRAHADRKIGAAGARRDAERCLCGHRHDDHHDGVAECEFYGSNEEGGADREGAPHCGWFCARSDPDSGRRARWADAERANLHRWERERLAEILARLVFVLRDAMLQRARLRDEVGAEVRGATRELRAQARRQERRSARRTRELAAQVRVRRAGGGTP